MYPAKREHTHTHNISYVNVITIFRLPAIIGVFFFHFFFILVLFLFLAADVDIDPKPTVCACALCCVLDGNDHERHFSTFSFHLVLSLLLSLHNRICISYMAFIYRFFLLLFCRTIRYLAYFEPLPNETISKLPFHVHRVFFFGFYFWLLLAVIKGNFIPLVFVVAIAAAAQPNWAIASLNSVTITICEVWFTLFSIQSYVLYLYTFSFSCFFLLLMRIFVLCSLSVFSALLPYDLTCNVENHKSLRFCYLDLAYGSMQWEWHIRSFVFVFVCLYVCWFAPIDCQCIAYFEFLYGTLFFPKFYVSHPSKSL